MLVLQRRFLEIRKRKTFSVTITIRREYDTAKASDSWRQIGKHMI